jgi:hypothetical protein
MKAKSRILLGLLILSFTGCDLQNVIKGKDVTPAPTAPIDLPIEANRFEVRVLSYASCRYTVEVAPLLKKLRLDFPMMKFREYDIDTPGNQRYVTAYAPTGYPFFVVLDGGNIIDRNAGMPEHEDYLPYLKQLFKKAQASRP